MEKPVELMIESVIGQSVWRSIVFNDRAISFALGKEIAQSITISARSRGEWEFGSYSAAWRVIRNNRILLGSNDVMGDASEKNAILEQIDFGRVSGVESIGIHDVVVKFDSGIDVEFFCNFSFDDEVFFLFCPPHQCVVLSVNGDWSVQNTRN